MPWKELMPPPKKKATTLVRNSPVYVSSNGVSSRIKQNLVISIDPEEFDFSWLKPDTTCKVEIGEGINERQMRLSAGTLFEVKRAPIGNKTTGVQRLLIRLPAQPDQHREKCRPTTVSFQAVDDSLIIHLPVWCFSASTKKPPFKIGS